MIELEQDEIAEGTEYESTDSYYDSSDDSSVYPEMTRTHYADKARFEPLPDESRPIGKWAWKNESA